MHRVGYEYYSVNVYLRQCCGSRGSAREIRRPIVITLLFPRKDWITRIASSFTVLSSTCAYYMISSQDNPGPCRDIKYVHQ